MGSDTAVRAVCSILNITFSSACFLPRAALASRSRASGARKAEGGPGECRGIAVDGSSASTAAAATQPLAEAAERRPLPLRGRYFCVSPAHAVQREPPAQRAGPSACTGVRYRRAAVKLARG